MTVTFESYSEAQKLPGLVKDLANKAMVLARRDSRKAEVFLQSVDALVGMATTIDVADEAGDWTNRALCKNQPDGIIFEERDDRIIRYVKLMCNSCPVRQQCLDTAMSEEAVGNLPRDYIRGGYTGRERDRLASKSNGNRLKY